MALAFTMVSAGAVAKGKKCDVVGNWTDSYGAMATFKTDRRGTATAAIICSGSYSLAVTKLTETVFDISATSKNKSCPAITVALTFAKGSCTSASGTLMAEGQSLADTWTKSGKLVSRAAAPSPALTNGLK